MDWQINDEDTPGDEGELFSNLVQGLELSESQLQAVQSEDDAIVFKLAKNWIEIEQNSFIGIIPKSWIYIPISFGG